MSLPMLTQCCCCSLRVGTIVIGCFYTLWSLLCVVAFSLLLTLWPLDSGSELSTHKYVFYIFMAGISGVHMLVSLLLFVAVAKEIPWMTLPWTILTGIIAALNFIVSLTAISLILQDTGKTLVFDIVTICPILLMTCISLYCIMVVHSWHKNLMGFESGSIRRQNNRNGLSVEKIPLNDLPLGPHQTAVFLEG